MGRPIIVIRPVAFVYAKGFFGLGSGTATEQKNPDIFLFRFEILLPETRPRVRLPGHAKNRAFRRWRGSRGLLRNPLEPYNPLRPNGPISSR
jgi:hypothetical protein